MCHRSLLFTITTVAPVFGCTAVAILYTKSLYIHVLYGVDQVQVDDVIWAQTL